MPQKLGKPIPQEAPGGYARRRFLEPKWLLVKYLVPISKCLRVQAPQIAKNVSCDQTVGGSGYRKRDDMTYHMN
uniref:Uncharacterized protein n=1 Tax=Romanomermis culicivorax TaxID=13658 RepID=A0A915L5F6_ROMCU